MTYRDDDAATLRRRTQLTRDLDMLAPDEKQRAEDEIAAIDVARIDAARVRVPQVARAKIASPCTERWDTMLGDGAVRACSRCEKEVFDLSQMTLGQAEALLAEKSGDGICVRMYKRSDGTMMFSDCIVGARGVMKRDVLRVGAAIAIGGATLAWTSAPAPIAASAPPRASSAEARAAADAFIRPAAPPFEMPVRGEVTWPVSEMYEGYHWETGGPMSYPTRTTYRAVQIDGTAFDAELVTSALRAHANDIEDAFDHGLDPPALSGHVTLRLTVQPNGRFSDVSATADFRDAQDALATLARIARRIRLPQCPTERARYEITLEVRPR